MNDANMGFNKYCGPAALSILTGKNTDICADAISRINGQYKIKGVLVKDLVAAGNRLGLDFNYLGVYGGRSLFFSATQLVSRPGKYLVIIPDHYIVLEVRDRTLHLCDNHTKTPIDLANSARLHQKVQGVYQVTEREMPPAPTLVSSELSVSFSTNTVFFKRVQKYSDDTFKIYHLGSANVSKDEIQDLAFEMMKLVDNSGD